MFYELVQARDILLLFFISYDRYTKLSGRSFSLNANTKQVASASRLQNLYFYGFFHIQ